MRSPLVSTTVFAGFERAPGAAARNVEGVPRRAMSKVLAFPEAGTAAGDPYQHLAKSRSVGAAVETGSNNGERERMVADRVPENTSDDVNEAIRRETDESLLRLAEQVRAMEGQLDTLEARLQALDEEWDIERTLQANASSLALAGLTFGLIVSRRFLALPVAVAVFLMQHAFQGWCPPLPFFRRRGVRTRAEIEEERYALKAFRGDFDSLPETPETGGEARMTAALSAVRK